MKTETKHTPGPWKIKSGDSLAIQALNKDIAIVCAPLTTTVTEKIANARLIAEAGTVATETGLTPRQLAEQWAELLDFVASIVEMTEEGDINKQSIIKPGVSIRREARRLLAKANG